MATDLGTLNLSALTSLVNLVVTAQTSPDAPPEAPGGFNSESFKFDADSNLILQDGQPVPTNWILNEATGRHEPPVDLNADPEKKPPKYSTDQPFDSEYVVQWVDALGFDQVPITLARDFVNAWADELNAGTPQDPVWPSRSDLVDNPDFFNGIVGMALQLSENPPPAAFWFSDGNRISLASIDPLRGLQFTDPYPELVYEVEDVPEGVSPPVIDPREIAQRNFPMPTPAGELPADQRPTFEPRIDRIIDQLDPELQAAVRGTISQTGLGGVKTVSPIAPTYPTLTTADLAAILNPPDKDKGGAGGGTTRQELAFDRDQLTEYASDLWNRWLIEPADQAAVAGWVDKYVREAQAFWMADGGRKDFDTFVQNEIRKLPRYSTVMRWKPDDMEEDAFITSYSNVVGQFGLRPDQTRSELFKSVTSGGSTAGQTQRILNTREVSRRPQFAQRFANTLSGLGAGVTEF